MSEAGDVRDFNPVDVLIRRTFCYYREQREPIKAVPYDDPNLIKFMRESMRDLEKQVDQAVFDWEYERQQRREFEKKVRKNQAIVDSLKRDAEREADKTFNRISGNAAQKARSGGRP